MASEWLPATLDQLGQIITGKTPSSSRPEYFGGEIPFITPSDFDGRRLIAHTARYLTQEGVEAVGSSRIPGGSVMVSCIGSDMGKAAIAARHSVTNQQINSIIVEPKNNALFVYYNLSKRKAEIRNSASGSAQPILNKTAFGQLEILLPPSSEQQAIALVLGTLDDKIELNRRMNETLEAIARAIFKSWFVDFDPVRAKAAGCQPYTMNAAAADLFPSTFGSSQYGDIPTGWHVVSLSESCSNIFSGGTPDTRIATYWHGSIPWLSSRETREKFIVSTQKTITELGIANSSTRLARARSTVVASAGQGNTRGQASFLSFDSYINQSVVVLVANRSISSDLFLFFDMDRRYEEFRRISDSSSSRGSLTTKLLGGIRVLLPRLQIIQKFEETVDPIVARICTAERESLTVAALRDTLLPKLLSGEVRVKQAEKAMEAVL